ncbi:MAG: HEAT repeat domain-containing protein [Planctomycetaceae bacterium]|nr:HEAT repeat domain-containing protein [Planctomycetaceae bacterium]
MRHWCLFAIIVFLVGEASPIYGAGLTPNSPEVLASVAKGVAYLNANGAQEHRTGGKALIGLALLKAGEDADHPLIQAAVAEIRKKMTPEKISFQYPIYEIGISAMFLSELDPVLYQNELRYLAEALRFTQQRFGGWGYLSSDGTLSPDGGGDMSMTQYAVMGAWSIHRSGGKISGPMMTAVGKWLFYVQADDGAYAYTSRIDANGQVSRDNTMRPSTTAAGMASVYVLRDLFGMNSYQEGSQPKESGEFVPPKAFQKIYEEESTTSGVNIREARKSLPLTSFKRVQDRGNNWLREKFQISLDKNTEYFCYYLYAMERYCSFREFAENVRDPSPVWYNQIAEYLMKLQDMNGSWANCGLDPQVDTAYAILVLRRSTKQTLDKGPATFDGGNMQGGRGLPRSTDFLEVRDGQVISLTEVKSIDSLLEGLDDLAEWDEEMEQRLANVTQTEVSEILSQNKEKIIQLLQTGSPEMRLTAVDVLRKSGDVRFAPALIYALSDPDPTVAAAAQTALGTISRNLKNEPLPPSQDKEYEAKRQKIIDQWKKWYSSLTL